MGYLIGTTPPFPSWMHLDKMHKGIRFIQMNEGIENEESKISSEMWAHDKQWNNKYTCDANTQSLYRGDFPFSDRSLNGIICFCWRKQIKWYGALMMMVWFMAHISGVNQMWNGIFSEGNGWFRWLNHNNFNEFIVFVYCLNGAKVLEWKKKKKNTNENN